MQCQRQRDTKPELSLRRALHARGWRYRVDVAPLPGLRRRADLVFTRRKLAVYVDGCFWHRCPVHGTVPKTNTDWWIDKLNGNVARDRDTDRRLRDAGWIVVRIWEHLPLDHALELVERALGSSKEDPKSALVSSDLHDFPQTSSRVAASDNSADSSVSV